MKRFLFIVVLVVMTTGCLSSSDDSTPVETSSDGLDLKPTATILEKPPTNGKLPASMLPPV